MVNFTLTQLEEFESTFRYFHKDEINTLYIAELIVALASLGIVYSGEDTERSLLRRLLMFGVYSFFLSETNRLLYFLFFQVEFMEGHRSPEQLREAFRGIARLRLR